MNYESDLVHFSSVKNGVAEKKENCVHKEKAFNSRQLHISHRIMFTFMYISNDGGKKTATGITNERFT